MPPSHGPLPSLSSALPARAPMATTEHKGAAQLDKGAAQLVGVVQKSLAPGYTERRQSRAGQTIPHLECYPDLNHANLPLPDHCHRLVAGQRSLRRPETAKAEARIDQP